MNNLMSDFVPSLDIGMAAGNSARLLRGSVAIILAILVIGGIKLFIKISTRNEKVKSYLPFILKLYVAFIAGALILWSNDYGITSYTCFSFIYLCIIIKFYKRNIKKILKSVFLYVLVSICSVFLVMLLITRGDIMSWISFTEGVSQSQAWYFGTTPQEKSFFIYNIDNNFITLFTFMLALFYLYKLFKKDHSVSTIIRYGAPAYLLLSGFFATNMYKLLSGGAYREVTYLILLIIIFSEFTSLLKKGMKLEWTTRLRPTIMIILLLFSSSYCLYNGIDKILERHPGAYFEGLNGYITDLAPSLNSAAKKIGHDKIFSTYSSAVEIITNQFQPSGNDYIIHVLGEKQRQKYLSSFLKGDFAYAATIRNSYTNWEYWIRNANWYFYRQLYNQYNPAFVTDYEMFWEKSKEKNILHPEMTMNIERLTNHSFKIKLNTKDPTINGTADVSISYHTERNKSFFKTLAFQNMIFVQEVSQMQFIDNTGYCNFFIPKNSDCYYIPITIVNGSGEVILDSYPNTGFGFVLNQVKVEGVFLNPFNYLFLSNVDDENWQNGISRSESTLLLQNTIENQLIINGAKKLRAEDGKCISVFKTETVGDYIRVLSTEQTDLSAFAYPNGIEAIK
jgi:hypothetical protein